MTAVLRRRGVLRVVVVLLAVLGLTGGQVSRPDPARAIPPIYLCDSQDDVGKTYIEWVSVYGSDYIVWECTYFPTWHMYWWRLADIRNAEEDARAFYDSWKRFVGEEVWAGIVQGAIGEIDADGDWRNNNIDSVATFSLRGPNGSPIYRTLGARIIVGVSRNGGQSWDACSDTGWRTSNPDVSAFSTKLQYPDGPKCGVGHYRTQAAGRFKSVSTGQWVTTGWVYTPMMFAGPPTTPPTSAF